MSHRWQYQVVEIKIGVMGGLKQDALQEVLTRQGLQGWELVQILSPAPMQHMAAVFKRPA